jgi:uncharacterized phage protein (TIGR02218 family)
VTEWLAAPVSTVALCWRLSRRDGMTLGLTTHDRNLVVDGVLYRAAPGMTPSAISLTDGFDADTLDLQCALAHDAITEQDLAAGRWDGAAVRLFAVDWTDPSAPLTLAWGDLSEIELRDGAFTGELAGPTLPLDKPVVEITSPDCQAELGDKRCRVDLAPRTRFAHVVHSEGAILTTDAEEPGAGAYAQGRLAWIDGANSGLHSLIAASSGAALTLREAPVFPVEPGTMVRITEGCDRTLATCRARFGNATNFRGEPFLPGNDLLTRYPGG